MEDKNLKNTLQRDFSECGVRVLSEEERTVELSFSSEAPVERWGGYEILEHKRDSVLLDRLRTSGCLLFNHDRDKVIGKIVSVEIKNKRGIATVQFDTDDKSEIIFQKVKNETLRCTSVGYRIKEYKREVSGKGDNIVVTFRAVKWEPFEISIVSVPADITVGVGRSMEEKKRSFKMLENQIKVNGNRR